MKAEKPLGGKAYGSIPHLPGSRRGPGDHGISESQASICTIKVRDERDRVIVQEKLDGSCCAVARIANEIVPMVRAGYPAMSSPFKMHHMFHDWVMGYATLFRQLLSPGERIVGEWLAQAHGTRYKLPHGPFVAFDFFDGSARVPHWIFLRKIDQLLPTPRVISSGPAISIEDVVKKLEPSGHGAIDPVEGAVWRVERNSKVDFLAKYVRPEKVDGAYLPEKTGCEPVWDWP